MFEMINRIQPNLSPNSISCDFELPAFRAMQDSFPGAEIFGCFFHLCQNVKKHVGELHLNKRYNNEVDFALKAKMITALAFVPINDLDVAFDRLAGHLPVERCSGLRTSTSAA